MQKTPCEKSIWNRFYDLYKIADLGSRNGSSSFFVSSFSRDFSSPDFKLSSHASISMKFCTLVHYTNTSCAFFQFFNKFIFGRNMTVFSFLCLMKFFTACIVARQFPLFQCIFQCFNSNEIWHTRSLYEYLLCINSSFTIFIPKYHWILSLTGLLYFFKFEKKNSPFCVLLLFLHLCN